MAKRRMFNTDIVESDFFYDMPASTQNLYFHLGMQADDDGFIASAKKTMRALGATDDDLKLLVAKKFVLVFESGVFVVKHWRMNNYIKSDRYEETTFKDEKAQLHIKDKGIYTFDPSYPLLVSGTNNTLSPKCLQNVSKMVPQDRDRDSIEIDKSKDRDSIEIEIIQGNPEKKSPSNFSENFKSFLSLYPEKRIDNDLSNLYQVFMEYVPDQETWQKIETALPIQVNSKDWHNENGKYIPLASNYLKNRKWDEVIIPPAPLKNNSDPNRFLKGLGSVSRY